MLLACLLLPGRKIDAILKHKKDSLIPKGLFPYTTWTPTALSCSTESHGLLCLPDLEGSWFAVDFYHQCWPPVRHVWFHRVYKNTINHTHRFQVLQRFILCSHSACQRELENWGFKRSFSGVLKLSPNSLLKIHLTLHLWFSPPCRLVLSVLYWE